MAEVFISYAHATEKVAHGAAQALREDGYSVWIDDALPLHREFASVIEENLRAAKAVLVLWSAEARASRWVLAEADIAHELGVLVQVSLDGAPPPFPFNRMPCEVGVGWRGDSGAPVWRKIRESIAALARSSVPGPAMSPAAPSAQGPVKDRVAVSERLLAVLAFDNLSGDPELADFCDGVSEEIQQTVAHAAELKVVARSSSFQFRGAAKAVDKVAAALGATHLLDGSVRRSGSRVRITAELVECEGGSTLWASRFDGDLSDVFALQDHIAHAVAQALQLNLTRSGSPARLAPKAYDLFLRARNMLTQGTRLLGDVARQATPLLNEVVAEAPDYAPGWELLSLSQASAFRSSWTTVVEAERRADALAAAERALALDPRRSGAYVAQSIVAPWGAYQAREDLLKQALSISPNDPRALNEMADFCSTVGRFKDALGYAEQACEINPLMPTALIQMMHLRYCVGHYRDAIRMMQGLVERWPDNADILLALLNCASTVGCWEEFDQAAERIAMFEGEAHHWLSAARTFGESLRDPDPTFREKRLRNYTKVFETRGFLHLNLAESLSQLGFVDQAMELALKSQYDVFTPEAPMPVGIYAGVILTPWSALNKTPGFVQLSANLGLNNYWLETGHWPDCVNWTPYDFEAEVRGRAGHPT